MIKQSYLLHVAHGGFLLDRQTAIDGPDQLRHRELALVVDVGCLDAVLNYVSPVSSYISKYVNMQHGDMFYKWCIP